VRKKKKKKKKAQHLKAVTCHHKTGLALQMMTTIAIVPSFNPSEGQGL
jgi:hypothetical protein